MTIYINWPKPSEPARAYASQLQGETLVFAPSDQATDAERAQVARGAEVVVTRGAVDWLLADSPRLRWLSFTTAGIDAAWGEPLRRRMREGLRVTTASGIHGPQMAEHAMALLLAMSRALPQFFALQQQSVWQREPPVGGLVGELTAQHLVVVGMGHIGRELGRRAEAFGMQVHGIRSADDEPRVRELLALADHLVLLLPLTEASRGWLGAERLAQLKPSACVYNLARGPVLDEPALIDALRGGRLAGAGLDVTEQEPLPAESPLWRLPNVLITPHAGGASPHYFCRAAQQFAGNLSKLRAGEPMQAELSVERGY